MKPKLVSIVIPVYNEEQTIGDDLDVIIRTMEASDYDCDIIVVNDGSTDSSADIVQQRSLVKLIRPMNER
jgi:glycosyltransferase involved in cell wall biosynthesis